MFELNVDWMYEMWMGRAWVYCTWIGPGCGLDQVFFVDWMSMACVLAVLWMCIWISLGMF